MFEVTGNISLNHTDSVLLGELITVYRDRLERNTTRSVYHEGENALRDFGVSIPPQLKGFGGTLSWIEQGISALVDRSNLEGFVAPDMVDDPFEIDEILAGNDFYNEFPQAARSSAIHACSFLVVAEGDTEAGEPPVLILPRAADACAAIWDRRRRGLKGFLSIADVDDLGQPIELSMMTPEKVVTITKRPSGRWTVDSRRHDQGEVTVAPLVYRPTLSKPLGSSRITRASMYYVDAALRTMIRAETNAELYASPQYWLFGADKGAFTGDRWKAVMGRLFAIGNNEEGEQPTIQRFEAGSPQPYIEQIRMWATMFAGDQGMSVSSMGIVQDNPSSAEAIYAAKEDLIIDTRKANGSWGAGAARALRFAARIRDGVTSAPEGMQYLSAQFTDPSVVSPSAAADAFQKRSQMIDGLAETEVGLEMAGLTREQITRFKSERGRVSALDALSRLPGRDGPVEVEQGDDGDAG